MAIVLYDQEDGITLRYVVAIVVKLFHARFGQTDQLARRGHGAAGTAGCIDMVLGNEIAHWHEQREGAALSRIARELDFSAEQLCQLLADGKTETGSAELARRTGIGLLESLEDELLLLRRDANAGIFHREGSDLFCLAEHRMIIRPAGARQLGAHGDMTAGRKLHRIGKQVLENLLEPLGITMNGMWQVTREVDVEWQPLRLGHVAEASIDGVAQAGESNFLDLDGNCSGFDLGEIQNVVDQMQQIGARRMNVAGELHLAI